MSTYENVKGAASWLSKAVQKKYNDKKVDMKINTLEKRVSEQLLKLGALVYEHKLRGVPLDNEKINRICDEIDLINSKKATVSSQKGTQSGAKKPHAQPKQAQKQATEQKETVYVTLDRKENDLKIQRTSEGIKFLKFCPECRMGNDPAIDKCVDCGHEFSDTISF